MQTLLGPLALAYRVAMHLRNRRFDRVQPQRLEWPVISVGNLSVGGAGKTPLVIRLAQLLRASGCDVDVLSRGYGRTGVATLQVDPAGTAQQFGDEPLLIARSAGVPVFVGASRWHAGLLAEQREPAAAQPRRAAAPAHLHLLDDGFQHRQLARAIDMVLVHRDDLTDRLLPLGRLREPLTALRRADAVVLREEDAALQADLRRYARPDCLWLQIRRTLQYQTKAQRIVAFCALARPQDFYRQLELSGAPLADRVSFRDHHVYTMHHAAQLSRRAQSLGADAFVTTEKDAVKLSPEFVGVLERVAPLSVARLAVEFLDETQAMQHLLQLLGGRESAASGAPGKGKPV